jgi:dipeptide transport system permease protein
MWQYLIRRLLWVPVTLLGIITITFALLYLVPGDPVANIVGQHADRETIMAIRQELGLDKPVLEQYVGYLARTLQGDLGRSYQSKLDVLSSILERFPATFLLAVSAVAISVIIGVTSGILSAVYQ